MAVLAIVLAVINILGALAALEGGPESVDAALGSTIIAIPTLLLASISLAQRRGGKPFSIIGIVLTVIALLIVMSV